jgi:hypothetical protein
VPRQAPRLTCLSAPSDTKSLIETAIRRFLEEVPGLAPLTITAGLELHGRGDVQFYRIVMPGPQVTKAVPSDAKVTLEIRRERFNELATKGHVAEWRQAFEHGDARATGIDQYLKLIVKVVEAQEERTRTRRARH